MKTYKLTTAEEIRDMLESTLMVNEAKAYFQELEYFFWNKSQALLKILVHEDNGLDAKDLRHDFVNTYEYPYDISQLQGFLADYKALNDHLFFFDGNIQDIITWQLKKPITVPYDDDESNCLEHISDEYYSRYKETFVPSHIIKQIFHDSNLAGFRTPDELHEFEQFWHLNDFFEP